MTAARRLKDRRCARRVNFRTTVVNTDAAGTGADALQLQPRDGVEAPREPDDDLETRGRRVDEGTVYRMSDVGLIASGKTPTDRRDRITRTAHVHRS